MTPARLFILLPFALLLTACGPNVKTRTATWPNGHLRAQESYYTKSDWDFGGTLHGPATYWDEQGHLVAQGTWKHGKPYDGVCWIPALGDAGSWGGLGHFEQFKAGKSLGKVATTQVIAP